MASIRTTNPATGETLRIYELMARDEALAVLARVHAAQAQWGTLSAAERAAFAPRLAAVLRAHAEEWARLMSCEMGKPVTEARAEVEKCAWLCEVYGAQAAGWLAEDEVTADGRRHRVLYQPLGVVLSIMPWNFPFWQALRFGVPTLLAGNASVLKHASNVTGCALAIEQAFRDAGFPEDVFRVVIADHHTVGALIADSRVAGISLTGSTEAGRRIAAAAGRELKKCVLELGGSDPFIVLADADLDAAVAGAVRSRCLNTGQSCIAAKRFIVERPVAEQFAARFASEMAKLRVGDPLDDATQVGAIVNEGELMTLLAQLQDAISRGARVSCGGGRIDRSGYFLSPTVLRDVSPKMRVWQEEVFGPIAPVLWVADADEAISVANDTEFGLGASVWTRDRERGETIARRLACGSVFVNSIVKSDPRMPFGGVKQSGWGRELAWFGLREFTNVKGLNVY